MADHEYEAYRRDVECTVRQISSTVSKIRDFETEETGRCHYPLYEYLLLVAPSVTDGEKEKIAKTLEVLKTASHGLHRHPLSPAYCHDFYKWHPHGFATVIGKARDYRSALTEASAFAYTLLRKYHISCHETATGIKYHLDRLESSEERLKQLDEYIAELEQHRDRLSRCACEMARL